MLNTEDSYVSQESVNDIIQLMIKRSQSVFSSKQKHYTENNGAFANFVTGARVRYGDDSYESQIKTAIDYCTKHIANVYNQSGELKDTESTLDIANYMFIISAMIELKKQRDLATDEEEYEERSIYE